jgi:hypothetical protein
VANSRIDGNPIKRHVHDLHDQFTARWPDYCYHRQWAVVCAA